MPSFLRRCADTLPSNSAVVGPSSLCTGQRMALRFSRTIDPDGAHDKWYETGQRLHVSIIAPSPEPPHSAQ